MIVLRDVSLRRGVKLLFENVSLLIHRGQKVGLTGANGTGKSSLFSLLLGELHANAGDVDIQAGLVIAHVAQEHDFGTRSAIDFVLDGDAEMRAVQADLAAAEYSNDGTRIAELHEVFDRIGGYSANARASTLLHGLGFADADFARQVTEFSGGWRMRLALGRALMCRSDLLILDEPTNHLDLDAVLWLEQWLGLYRGTLLVISHDREFLDNTVNAVCHIEQRGMRLYSGNYTAFETQRVEQLALQRASYEKQQRTVAHLRSFIDRFGAKASKARQAQSRVKALARMEMISAAHVDSPFEFEFRPPLSQPDPLLTLRDANVGYAGRSVVSGINFAILSGARLGLLGRNGAGKSTFMKMLAGEIPVMSGERLEGKGLRIGYFAQHQTEALRVEYGPLWHLQQVDPRSREQDLRNFLGGFDFRGDAATAPVGPMSGGEKSRLALALVVWQRPNLLLLDEPTNHLDLDMRHALTVALQSFEGAMVLVSHDRGLLRSTTDDLLLVSESRVASYTGDLDDYARQVVQTDGAKPNEKIGQEVPTRKEQKRTEAAARARLSTLRKPLEAQLRTVETKMAQLGQQKQNLEMTIAAPDMYDERNRGLLKNHLAEQTRIGSELARAEEQWMMLTAELESLLTTAL